MSTTFGTQESPCLRRPVAWYSPPVLWQAGRELLQSASFQRNLDRRETFSPVLQPLDFSERTASSSQPFWFDFMSDTGDGGNATFTVAQALLKRELQVSTGPGGSPTLSLPEGELLILGGDLAYPTASPEEYQYRFIEPFALARDPASRFARHEPDLAVPVPEGPQKFIVGIPQNHDWFDSASTFCRYFVNYDKGAVNGARTPQRQTWFAARLPQGFWLLGLDFALVGDIDRQQLEAFMALLRPGQDEGIRPGDDVLLLYPEPYWTRPLGDGAWPGYPKRYQRLEAAIEAAGARIRLRLAGDLHHYARQTLAADPLTQRDSHLVTCGVGGAFAHPTHCQDVQAPKVLSREPEPHAVSPDLQHRVRTGRVSQADPALPRFEPQAVWPSAALSRLLAWGNLWALFRIGFSRSPFKLGVQQTLDELWNSNFGFALCLGVIYGLNAYVNSGVFQVSFGQDGFAPMATLPFGTAAVLWLKAMVFSPFAAFINLGLLTGCVRIAWEGPGPQVWRLLNGLLHGMAHGFLIFALYWLSCVSLQHAGLEALGVKAAMGQWLPGPWLATAAALATWVSVGVMGVVAGGLLFGAYLALMCAVLAQLPNNAFGSLAIADYKGFLRCRITETGLEVFLIGLDTMPQRPSFDDPLPSGWRVVDRFEIKK
ncbi:MAG: hypothetical protein C4K60_15995 [Ideonella sp. MAG2]|nr:MAG: hypothetical protein C4K60_15995 [Ideonella sp. MAG2]